ncbi:hypothetical protein GL50803_008371 [Giardia duodenalis]|uniref:Uncharacterized protein n=1 Tax=Giardia intestinalis (strain ATCC 50803 / WB clone C6) TaxID=184922 RepID=A8BKV7_GIAIC|nr:hypothetical protein GL50803_008371 [Giardia intestinalis]KAE8301623.1 hypothetical protein GL50803_008371 [Giardia intestinalis]|eukprot:XP_001706357.1 Hypothetical protein GL50803_8371 [Giardia lamblia ATCC 50803]
MDPSGIYLNDLESFTDDLSKYDAKLYLGLDELSIARRTAVNTQKEAATLHPHPPPPLYAPGARLPVDYQQDHSHQFSRASEHKESNVAFRPKRPTSGAAQFYPQYPLPYAQHSQPIFSQRSASATPYQVPQMPSTMAPRPASSGIIYTSAAILKNRLADAPVQRQDNLFIRSTTTYREPVAVPCRLPVVPQLCYDYYDVPNYQY